MNAAARTRYGMVMQVTLTAPYLVHGVDPGRHGLDATLLRNHQGHLVLPGTLLAGRIAEAWFTLRADTANSSLGIEDPDEWFGAAGVVGEPQARRARIQVSDLVGPQAQSAPEHDITRLAQDVETGAGAGGQLMLVEQQHAAGAVVHFTGQWRVWATSAEMDRLCTQVAAALRMQTQLGAYRSIGYGRLGEVTVTALPVAAAPLEAAPSPTATRRRFALQASQPLCVGANSRRGNVFESDDVITGGTLKGCIATMLMQRAGVARLQELPATALAANFDAVRITHALPTPLGGVRPAPLPLSLALVPGQGEAGAVKDAWQFAHAPSAEQLPHALAFQPDWKTQVFNKERKVQGWGQVERHLRVRTDIDATGRAKESALFAYECVASPQACEKYPGTEWLFDVDLAGVDAVQREAVWQDLDALFQFGLAPLGKTDAHAVVERRALNESSVQASGVSELIPLLLVTPSLLFATDCIADKPQHDLLAIYRSAFDDLPCGGVNGGVAGALRLSHFFATQRLEGGDYLYRRFQRRSKERPEPYQPYVLTEAGSVFVFQVLSVDAAQKVLRHWCEHGLGIPSTMANHPRYGNTWLAQPYLPENGFGEVVVSSGMWERLEMPNSVGARP